MSWFNNLNLLPKLIALFTIIGVVPLAAVGWIARDQSSSELEHGASQSVSELAFNASDKLDRNLFERYVEGFSFLFFFFSNFFPCFCSGLISCNICFDFRALSLPGYNFITSCNCWMALSV